MKFIKLTVAAFFIAVFLSITVICQTTTKARVRTQSLRGVVQYEVVEATKFTESYFRFFIPQCDGAPCDFAKLRQNEVDNLFPSSVNIQNIYLEGKGIDFQALSGNEVILYGTTPLISRKSADDWYNKNVFEVSSVEKVFDKSSEILSTMSDLQVAMPPFTFPSVPTTGALPVLLVRLRHQAVAPSLYTQSQIKNWWFTGSTSIKKFFENQSTYIFGSRGFSMKGLLDVTGDVTLEITVTATATTANCEQYIGNEWRVDADNQLEALGYSKVAYPVRVYLYAPMPGCTSTASASGRNFGDTTTISQVIMQLPTNGTQAALDAKTRVAVHEMEHTLGQGSHSKGQQIENGPIIDEGDPGDPLGQNSLTYNHGINDLKFGWNVSRFVFSSIQYRGTWTISLQPPSVTLFGLRTKHGPVGAYIPLIDSSGNLTGDVLQLEAPRAPTTPPNVWETFGSDTQAFTTGVAMRKIGSNLSSSFTGTILIDGTPGTPCCKDAPLLPNASWTSALYDVTVTVIGTNSRGVTTVRVTLGSRYPIAPTSSGFQEESWVKRQ